MEYKNKVFWVTGASSGIGYALSLQLASKGARLILSGRNAEALAILKSECVQNANHHIVEFDVTQIDQLDKIVEKAWSFNNGIDVLINNAGISQRSLALETELAVDRLVMEVDYFATIALSKTIASKFIAQQSGMFINIASIAGKLGSPMRSAYSGAKHALIGFMDCLRTELAKDGIRVINVCPGFVRTNISKNALTGNLSKYEKMDKEIDTGMNANVFVQILLKKLNGSKSEIIIAKGIPLLGYQVRRLFPNFFHWISPKIYKKNH